MNCLSWICICGHEATVQTLVCNRWTEAEALSQKWNILRKPSPIIQYVPYPKEATWLQFLFFQESYFCTWLAVVEGEATLLYSWSLDTWAGPSPWRGAGHSMCESWCRMCCTPDPVCTNSLTNIFLMTFSIARVLNRRRDWSISWRIMGVAIACNFFYLC